MPRVSIGVPVYNGASLIRECLENLAAQTWRDFEVVISDNASTDGTSEICAEFCERDRRFRHVRHDRTSSAMENFLSVRRAAQSPLFLWRAFDDLSSPDYVEKLVEVHTAHPRVALAASAVLQRFAAPKRDRLKPYVDPPEGAHVAVLLHRMRKMQAGWFYGMWKLEAAERATEEVYSLFPDGWAADYLAILHAALHGGIAGSNEAVFHQRVLSEVRGYMPRRKPTFSEMTERNRRFAATCRTLIADSGVSPSERLLLSLYVPLFTNRCSHRAKRVLQAAARQLTGR